MMQKDSSFQTCGNRIKRARTLAGYMTRKAFAETHGISKNTLQSWEQDKHPLTRKGAIRLAQALQHEGIQCSVEWLLLGAGVHPIVNHFHRASSPQGQLSEQVSYNEQQAVNAEAQVFRAHHEQAVTYVIEDNAMEPYYHPGDHVGGIKLRAEDIEHFALNRHCIVETKNGLLIPRYLQPGTQAGRYTISSVNSKARSMVPLILFDIDIVSAAPIVWHRAYLKKQG